MAINLSKQNLLNKIGFNVLTSHLCDDNLGLLFCRFNPIQEKCSIHIDICYYYIGDLIENEQIKPYYINGKKNPTNILTYS